MEKNGGRPSKKTTGYEKEKTTGYENKKPNENENENENENDNDNVNGNENENKLALYDANVEKINNTFIETLGSTNINNIKECINYLDYMSYEVIEYALRKTARTGGNWNYTMAILDSYINKNIKTLEQAKEDDLNFKINNKTKEEAKEETIEEANARKLKALEEMMKK